MWLGSWIYNILIIAANVLGVLSTVYHIQYMAVIAFAIILALIVFYDTSSSFTTIVSTCLIANTITYNGVGLYWILMLVSIIKLFFSSKTLPTVGIIPLILLYVFHDSNVANLGIVLNYTVYLLFMFTIMCCFDDSQYDHKKTVFLFIISGLITIVGAILLTGDLTLLGNDSIAYYRLGEGDVDAGMNNNLGGAMEFPIIAMLVITFSLTLIIGKALTKFVKLIFLFVIVALFIITFFTTSRVYILGLITLVLFLGVYIFSSSVKPGAKLSFILIALLSIATLVQSGYMDIIEYRYGYRDDNSRLSIAIDCLNFLSNNPITLFFGEGYRGYINTGRLLGRLFSMSAHNIILDCIMAYGLLGIGMILHQTKKMYNRLLPYYDSTVLLRWMPVICWFMMNLTNSSFMLCKTYVIIPFLIIHLKKCSLLTDKTI